MPRLCKKAPNLWMRNLHNFLGKISMRTSQQFKRTLITKQSLRKHSTAKGLSRQPLRVAQIPCSYPEIVPRKEAVDSVGQLNLEETTETKESNPIDTITSSTTIAKESAEAVESLKGTRRIHRDSPEELLLITKRGNFFQDSFFLDAHRDFSAALRQVLGRCNQDNFEDDTDLRHTDILERYRQLRSRDLREENQAAIVTSDKVLYEDNYGRS
nr:uncharacterized protein LOC113825317 [Penaeus vannamei]